MWTPLELGLVGIKLLWTQLKLFINGDKPLITA